MLKLFEYMYTLSNALLSQVLKSVCCSIPTTVDGESYAWEMFCKWHLSMPTNGKGLRFQQFAAVSGGKFSRFCLV